MVSSHVARPPGIHLLTGLCSFCPRELEAGHTGDHAEGWGLGPEGL